MIWMFSSLIILEKRNNGIDFFFFLNANIQIQELISILHTHKRILVQAFDFVFVIFFLMIF